MIRPGSMKSPFDTAELHAMVLADVNNHSLPRKIRGADNAFITPSAELLDYVRSGLNGFDWFKDQDWEIELLISKEPVGVHNDRNEYDANGDTIGEVARRCDYGMIIPIEWHCRDPYTITYDVCYHRKVIYKKGALQDLKGNRVDAIPRSEMLISDEQFDAYFRDRNIWEYQLKGLNIHSIHKWEKDEIIIFEADRLHSSSNFVEGLGSYKMSLNALRYQHEDTK